MFCSAINGNDNMHEPFSRTCHHLLLECKPPSAHYMEQQQRWVCILRQIWSDSIVVSRLFSWNVDLCWLRAHRRHHTEHSPMWVSVGTHYTRIHINVIPREICHLYWAQPRADIMCHPQSSFCCIIFVRFGGERMNVSLCRPITLATRSRWLHIASLKLSQKKTNDLSAH